VREAVDWVERTDSTEHALELYEEKGYRPLVEQTRSALADLREGREAR
jgi:hypothetical protein